MPNRLRSEIDSLSSPISRDAAREALSGVMLLYGDGEEPLAGVVSRSNEDTFEDPRDLETEIYDNLPVEAVGEPGQSEGDG